MRVSSFAVAFLMADVVVEAGVCKPARTTTAGSLVTSTVESSTLLLATSTESIEVSLTESLVPTTETASSEVIETSTTESSIATTTTEADVTTTEEASATTTEAGPSATPGSIVGTGQVADQTLRGDASRFVPLSFTPSDSTQTLIFSLLNGQLSTGSNNNYLCLGYRNAGALGPLVLCPFDNFQNAPLTCTKASTGALSCTAPNGSCDPSGTCRRPNNAAPFSQFYVDSTGVGYFGPAGEFAGFTALGLTLAG